ARRARPGAGDQAGALCRVGGLGLARRLLRPRGPRGRAGHRARVVPPRRMSRPVSARRRPAPEPGAAAQETHAHGAGRRAGRETHRRPSGSTLHRPHHPRFPRTSETLMNGSALLRLSATAALALTTLLPVAAAQGGGFTGGDVYMSNDALYAS